MSAKRCRRKPAFLLAGFCRSAPARDEAAIHGRELHGRLQAGSYAWRAASFAGFRLEPLLLVEESLRRERNFARAFALGRRDREPRRGPLQAFDDSLGERIALFRRDQ